MRNGWAANLLCLRVGDVGCLIQSLTKPRPVRDVMGYVTGPDLSGKVVLVVICLSEYG
jgi:hypothetical protein